MGKETKRVIQLLDKVTEKAARRLVIAIHGGLVEETPVATGWAMNNWIPSVKMPVTKTAGDPKNVSSAIMTGGIVDILNWHFEDGSAWVANNVPYINRLNAGHSAQAPVGFVDKVIQKEVNKAKRKKLI
jgi:hypothetical protein